jgi:acetolactate synthase-1/2/3 large subunit
MSAEKTKLNGVQRMVKGSDLLVRTLEEMGVRTIYGLPGEENLDIMESIRNSKKIEFEGTRHEQSAIYMAATSGRLTGQPGVCMATCAPGSLNFCNGADYAFHGGMPLVMIGGQKPIKSSWHGRFQQTDVVSVMRPITKISTQIVAPRLIPIAIKEAFRIAQEERPGPVYIEVPEDIAAEECEEDELW